ncbi:hypothetical protein Tco_1105624 [Tanacetum coccineum]
MQDMLPGVLSTVLILLGPTIMNPSSSPIECCTTVNHLVLHKSSGLSMSRWARCSGYCRIKELVKRFLVKSCLGADTRISCWIWRIGEISQQSSNITSTIGAKNNPPCPLPLSIAGHRILGARGAGNGCSLKDKNEAKTDKPSTGME